MDSIVQPFPEKGVKTGDNPESTRETPDTQTVEKAVLGDREAFGILFEQYVGKIYNYLYYRTGSSFDAEDLTARVFHRAFEHIGTYQHQGVPFLAWLYRIAHNLMANWYRDNGRRKEIPLEDQSNLNPHTEHPETALIQNQEQEMLLKAIRRLAGERQQLLILKYVEGLSNAEIALIMDRTEGAIKSLYHRTLLVLRDELEKMEHR